MSHAVFQRILSYIEQGITRKQVLGGNKVISPKERLALTISHTQNCLALLPSLHLWLRLLNYACACSTMLKERDKWRQLCINIPNILENKRNVERMLKQCLKAFKLLQHRFNILSTGFNNVERGWQTLSTLPFNKIESMLKQFVRAFIQEWQLIRDKKKCNQYTAFLFLSFSPTPFLLFTKSQDIWKSSEEQIGICITFTWFQTLRLRKRGFRHETGSRIFYIHTCWHPSVSADNGVCALRCQSVVEPQRRLWM